MADDERDPLAMARELLRIPDPELEAAVKAENEAERLHESMACEHGHQRRKCPHCEAATTIAELRAEAEKLRQRAEKAEANHQAILRRHLMSPVAHCPFCGCWVSSVPCSACSRVKQAEAARDAAQAKLAALREAVDRFTGDCDPYEPRVPLDAWAELVIAAVQAGDAKGG